MSEKQSIVDSWMEVFTNTAIGFGVAMVGNALILPWLFGIKLDVVGNIYCALLYTGLSIARQFVIRRLFNGKSPWQWVKGKFA